MAGTTAIAAPCDDGWDSVYEELPAEVCAVDGRLRPRPDPGHRPDGFPLSPGCDAPVDAGPEDMRALCDAGRESGS